MRITITFHKAFTALCLLLLSASQAVAQQKYVGGDISMLPRYEEAGAIYYDHDGNSVTDVLSFLKQQGWNALRVRLFVDPKKQTTQYDETTGQYTLVTDENVCQDLEWVKTLGKRIKDAGFSFLLDLHYSDTWADPGKQWTPSNWTSLNDNSLARQVYTYTKDVLEQLKAAGAEPDMIQTGNEISYGMLWGSYDATTKYQCWPSSPTANWTRFYKLLKQATQACRDVCPSAKIVLHVERVSTSQQNDNSGYAALTGFFDKMKAQGIDYDVIGLSYYPYFHGSLDELEGAIDKVEGYGKSIMIVETGYPYAWAMGGTTFDYSSTYDYSDEGQKAFTDSLIDMLNKHNDVTGLFWWWPEYNAYGTSFSGWYNAPLFDSRTGRATSALSELKKFAASTNGVASVQVERPLAGDDKWYNLQGQGFDKPVAGGVYIHNGRKFTVR
jgi:arabinogalactan endo-1,4-beta-galactosidase